jgi:hypothetical protein
MNVERFCEFLERLGHHTVKSESGWWFNAGPGLYESIPPFALIGPSEQEIRRLLWRPDVMGVKYYADIDQTPAGKPSFLYVVEDESYDLSHLQSKVRRRIKRYLDQCEVRQFDFDRLYETGMPLNQDTLARQKRTDPMFDSEAGWKQFCEAGRDVEGAQVWGAFVDGELAAYMMAFVIDGYCNCLYQMSWSKYLDMRVNHILTFRATQQMIALPYVHCVSQGHETVRDIEGLDTYKIRMGFTKRPLRQVVKLHPAVRLALMSPPGQWALDALMQRRPDNDFLIRLRGVLEFARYSYP